MVRAYFLVKTDAQNSGHSCLLTYIKLGQSRWPVTDNQSLHHGPEKWFSGKEQDAFPKINSKQGNKQISHQSCYLPHTGSLILPRCCDIHRGNREGPGGTTHACSHATFICEEAGWCHFKQDGVCCIVTAPPLGRGLLSPLCSQVWTWWLGPL